jgi:hypothetical protein
MYYIGNFQYVTDRQNQIEIERRHGDFSMLVEAESSEDALQLFRSRMISFRESSGLFPGDCEIYITQLLEFANLPSTEAVLFNFKSFAGDPSMPYIACVVPTEQSNACTIHRWDNDQPVTENDKDSLFIEFKQQQVIVE